MIGVVGLQTKESKREIRAYYRSIKLCPECKTNKLFGDEKTCIECRAESANKKLEYNRENRELVNANQRRTSKIRYENDLANGICYRCRKRKALEGQGRCGICRERDNERRRAKNYKPYKRKERYLQGLCYFCDNEIKDGYKVCEKHYQMCCENQKKSSRDSNSGFKFVFGSKLRGGK